MEFSLAPLRGITGKEFRTALTHNYTGIDVCMLPFFSITENTLPKFKNFTAGFTDEELLLKCNYLTIPQLIGNDPPALARVSKMFVDNGFPNININLGCPMPQITKKKRGSGLLIHPDIIERILNELTKVEGLTLSLKVRLGLKTSDDIFNLVEMFNSFPIDEIYVHPRLAIDRYEGNVRLDESDKLLKLLNHKRIYNGDIVSLEFFDMIKERYDSINSFMVGRGLVANPALVEEIISGKSLGKDEKLKRFKEFYKELVFQLERRTNDPLPMLKSYWQYFCCNFDEPESIYRKMVTRQSIGEMGLD